MFIKRKEPHVSAAIRLLKNVINGLNAIFFHTI